MQNGGNPGPGTLGEVPRTGHGHDHGHAFPPPEVYHPPFYPYGGSYPYFFYHAPSPGGSVYNSGNNKNDSGTQINGSVEVGNSSTKSSKHVEIGTIGGNHGTEGGQQRSGNVAVRDITG